MSRLTVAPIVEGRGEEQAVRLLLYRIWTELLGGEHIEVLRPIRIDRGRLVNKPTELARAVVLAHAKVQQAGGGLVLILIDAEKDCLHRREPLGPYLLALAKAARADADIACVVANVMFETWFVASVEALSAHLALRTDERAPADPESDQLGKGWIKQWIRHGRYSETADQPRLTATMDLEACRDKCPSFDKLCRELAKRMSAAS